MLSACSPRGDRGGLRILADGDRGGRGLDLPAGDPPARHGDDECGRARHRAVRAAVSAGSGSGAAPARGGRDRRAWWHSRRHWAGLVRALRSGPAGTLTGRRPCPIACAGADSCWGRRSPRGAGVALGGSIGTLSWLCPFENADRSLTKLLIFWYVATHSLNRASIATRRLMLEEGCEGTTDHTDKNIFRRTTYGLQDIDAGTGASQHRRGALGSATNHQQG